MATLERPSSLRCSPLPTTTTHAELIKLQVVLTRWRRRVLAVAARWAASIASHVKGWSFLRGFVEVVRLDAARFVETAALLYRTAPILHLDLENVKPVAAERRTSPHLGALRWLGLSNNAIGEAGLDALAASSHLPALGYLDFRWNSVDDPTPQDADEYSADTPAATALQTKYGKRPWLTAKPRFAWPPERDAVVE